MTINRRKFVTSSAAGAALASVGPYFWPKGARAADTVKVGAIYRVTDNLKLGASLHSPTLYNIEETYSTSITTRFSTESYTENSNINYFEYELLTPWKASLSASAIFNKNILISLNFF